MTPATSREHGRPRDGEGGGAARREAKHLIDAPSASGSPMIAPALTIEPEVLWGDIVAFHETAEPD